MAVRTEQPPEPPPPRASRRTPVSLWCVFSPDADAAGQPLKGGTSSSVVIGRLDAQTNGISDRWLSNEHARICGLPGGQSWRITDLGTTNGTFVNRERVHEAAIREGDVVRVGASLFVAAAGAEVAGGDLGLIGLSAAMAEVRSLIRRHAQSKDPVHVTGETGTGKELVAGALHAASGRSGSLVRFNMATVVETLAEAQLFGHLPHAFSGAKVRGRGLFEEADGGTLFMDEIAELSGELQAKLLRVVEEGELFPLGASRPSKVDVRVVTATHQDLLDLVESSRFRSDLYWRLVQGVIEIPPLRDRRLDICPIANHFLRDSGAGPLTALAQQGEIAPWHAADLIERLLVYSWPGNVRELRTECRQLASAIAERAQNSPLDPIPPVEDCLSPRVAEYRPEPQVQRTRSIVEQTAVETAFSEPRSLEEAIIRQSRGNIKAFAALSAPYLGKTEPTIRRMVYRMLDRAAIQRIRDRAANAAVADDEVVP